MGQFDPKVGEIKLHTSQFLEAAKFLGTSTVVKLVQGMSRDIYKDPDYTYKSAKDLDVILDERPNRYVLDSYGWYNEDDESVPILMYVAKHGPQGEIIKPLTGTIVLLPYELVEDEKRYRPYKISNSILMNPGSWMWVCKLTPYRYPKKDSDIDFEIDDNYDFLDIKA